MSVDNQKNIYLIASNPHGIERITEFLEENFISMGLPGIGDLENVSQEDLKGRLIQVYNCQGQELADELNTLDEFVHVMQDGDYVLLADQDMVHLGDVGDYYYLEQFDTAEDGICHRRGVTWLNSIPRVELNAAVQELLSHRDPIKRFDQPLSSLQLDRWLLFSISDVSKQEKPIYVDDQTIEEALNILKQAMRCEDVDRRERAAIAILQYAKS